ncbi:MAG: hypothetical protein IT457_16105 [Planctomycetes bacterium]|nr:hypothetical protein [Planctomycetota bacterium]
MQIDFLSGVAAVRDAVRRTLGSRLQLRIGVELPPPSQHQGGLLWIHGDPPSLDVEALALRVEQGQRLLLTGTATALLARTGIEPVAPEIRRGTWPADVGPRELRGVMALPAHPLFHRAPGGPYLLRARGDQPYAEAVWDRGRWPAVARVLGVEKLPIGCDATRAILLEARHGRGRVLALGAHLPLENGDPDFAEHRARFIGDLVDYSISDLAGERGAAWPHPGSTRGILVVHVAGRDAPTAQLPADPASDAALTRPLAPGDDASFVLTTRDGQAVYGRARRGIEEIWCRAFRAFRELDLRLAPAGEPLAALGDGVESATVHPDEFCWSWRRGASSASLRLARTAEGDGFSLSIRAGAGGALACELSGSSDLRALWPYPAGLSPELQAASSRQGAVLLLGDPLFGFGASLVSDQRPIRASIADASRPVLDGDGGAIVRFVREYRVAADAEFVITIRGRSPGIEDGVAAASPEAPTARTSLTVRTGQASIDGALALVQARIADFVAPLDAKSAGLVAGHDRSRRGWFTGRPGSAWFFGRDAFTCDAALLPFGAHDVVRADLALAARFQDPLGKIHHELTPLGVVHHDAADATPMFLDMLGRWFAWTGDREFVASLLPVIRRAVAFLVRTDRDGDGLAENAGVGHGWLEGGTLAQHVAIEVYLAAYTVRAWSAVALLGTALGDEPLATTGAAQATRAREALRTRFFRVEDGGFTHAIRTDGSRDDREAITSVMPWTLAIGEHGRESDALRRFATARAQADWGSRMLPTDDPAYDPASYQAGSVWPLFSGWTNLADFQYGRADTAWLRLLPLLRSVEQFAPGCVQEVFRGDVYRPRGIAAMQAWSHAAILSGFAQGLLGARESPDDGHVVLEPTLPGALDGLEFAGLRIRGATLSGRLARGEGGAGLEVELTLEGEPLELELAPFFPSPARVRGVTHDGVSLAMHEEALGDGVLVRTRVPLGIGSTRLRFDVLPDLLVAIEMPPLVQDRESSGPRFLGRRRIDADTVALTFELCAPASFPIRTPGRAVLAVTGAELEAGGSSLKVTPAAGTGHRACEVVVRFAPQND